ncbi:hypothetical protein ACRE_073430 [Hapsidospora chrysogenum ATCC 11550]|uniref:Uncharacterized protein n=1 Tax=Hapsidospora chrysogenum (strain ATCC 11550 / CBS 779.69 / DSM 880 / IAM 14645 / JCM 23072 / IMI 49137) TaxID=857340 RepID=A0A086SXX9_HAPC1|nr:hypothetical protein ACRE_073430 [Hapsidospora chrysogenum ATCC 11550]
MQFVLDADPADLPTISKIADQIGYDTHLNACLKGDQHERLVVAAIGWATFMFTYRAGDSDQHCIAIQQADPQTLKRLTAAIRTTSTRRPGHFLRSLELLDDLSDGETSQDRLLYLATLNYWSLKNIGNLHITWVPHISQHLKLDVTTRTLYLFQYPTLCALHCLGGTMNEYFTRLLSDYYPVDPPVSQPLEATTVHREILLSFRLLFGQLGKAKRRARRGPPLRWKKTGPLLSLPPQELAFLLKCVLPRSPDPVYRSFWPPSVVTAKGTLTNQEFYAPWVDFRVFGSRLCEVQKYNESQRPTRVRKMWRDRRDPARWCTVWVVMVLGILSLILSACQLAVGAGQLAVALKPPSDDKGSKAG